MSRFINDRLGLELNSFSWDGEKMVVSTASGGDIELSADDLAAAANLWREYVAATRLFPSMERPAALTPSTPPEEVQHLHAHGLDNPSLCKEEKRANWGPVPDGLLDQPHDRPVCSKCYRLVLQRVIHREHTEGFIHVPMEFTEDLNFDGGPRSWTATYPSLLGRRKSLSISRTEAQWIDGARNDSGIRRAVSTQAVRYIKEQLRAEAVAVHTEKRIQQAKDLNSQSPIQPDSEAARSLTMWGWERAAMECARGPRQAELVQELLAGTVAYNKTEVPLGRWPFTQMSITVGAARVSWKSWENLRDRLQEKGFRFIVDRKPDGSDPKVTMEAPK